MSHLITTLFPEARCIERSDIRIGDVLATAGFTRQANGSNPAGNGESIRIGRMAVHDERGCWRDEYNAPFLPPSGTAYLIQRPTKPLPTDEGSVIRLTEDFVLDDEHTIMAKTVLIVNHRGDFANHEHQQIDPERLHGAAFVVLGPVDDH